MSNVYPMRVYFGTMGSEVNVPIVPALPMIQPATQGILVLDRQVGDQYPGLYMIVGTKWQYVLEFKTLGVAAIEKNPLVLYAQLTSPVTVPAGSIVYANSYLFNSLTLPAGGARVYCVRLPSEIVPGENPDVMEFPAGANLSGHRVIQLVNNAAITLSSLDTDASCAAIGVSEGAASVGTTARVRVRGLLQEPSWAWVVGRPVFCGADGLLTQVAPSVGFSLIVGVATSSTSIFIDVKQPYILS